MPSNSKAKNQRTFILFNYTVEFRESVIGSQIAIGNRNARQWQMRDLPGLRPYRLAWRPFTGRSLSSWPPHTAMPEPHQAPDSADPMRRLAVVAPQAAELIPVLDDFRRRLRMLRLDEVTVRAVRQAVANVEAQLMQPVADQDTVRQELAVIVARLKSAARTLHRPEAARLADGLRTAFNGTPASLQPVIAEETAHVRDVITKDTADLRACFSKDAARSRGEDE
ncbi:hypothetical protein [Streptomyces sp. NPDC053079]|uniref:hypothetical protein n=1 Tax=Streptomyces sp. NPDC053079 TaxID=3365697 RepID=UPI0037CE97BB